MRQRIGVVIIVFLFSFSGLSEASWVKYVSPDRKISFHYPQGWKVNQQKTFIEIANLSSDEQMMMLMLPFDANKSPVELANYMIEAYRGDMPDFKASNYQDIGDGKGGGTVFEISSTNQGKTYRGNVFVLKTDNKAFWYQYTSPAKGYSPERALNLLNGFISSMDSGPNSQPPEELVQGGQQSMAEGAEKPGSSGEKRRLPDDYGVTQRGGTKSIKVYATAACSAIIDTRDSRWKDNPAPNNLMAGVDWCGRLSSSAYRTDCCFRASLALIKFNVQSQIAGRQIRKAVLGLFYKYGPSRLDAKRYPYSVSAVERDWNHTTVTFKNYPNTRVQIKATAKVPDDPGYMEFDVTEIVQQWSSNTWGNYGFQVSDSESMATIGKDLDKFCKLQRMLYFSYSVEPDPMNPYLYIEYQ